MSRIYGTTELTGILGYPVRHSISPLIHNLAFELAGLDICYVPFEVEPAKLEEALRGIVALGVRGVNVTVPHKEQVIPFLDGLSDNAAILGAVNTIVACGGTLHGDNTDAQGFINAWREEIGETLYGKNAVILGAGGSARAIYYSLARENVKRISLFNRNEERAQKLHCYYHSHFPQVEKFSFSINDGSNLRQEIRDADMVINCTSLGMHPRAGEKPIELPGEVKRSCIVYDLIYNPSRTMLMNEAEIKGLRAYGGLGMLLHQGALSFEIWTGKKFPIPQVKEYIRANLKL